MDIRKTIKPSIYTKGNISRSFPSTVITVGNSYNGLSKSNDFRINVWIKSLWSVSKRQNGWLQTAYIACVSLNHSTVAQPLPTVGLWLVCAENCQKINFWQIDNLFWALQRLLTVSNGWTQATQPQIYFIIFLITKMINKLSWCFFMIYPIHIAIVHHLKSANISNKLIIKFEVCMVCKLVK